LEKNSANAAWEKRRHELTAAGIPASTDSVGNPLH
jgi:hypothetical protein